MTDTQSRHAGDPLSVLLTGAGAPGASGIIKSLRATPEREIEIVAVDADEDAYGFALADAGYTVPHGEDPDYVDQMTEIAAAESVDVVLPLTTAELTPLSRHREAFDAAVMVSEPATLAIANDKPELYRFLDEQGFSVAPEFRLVDTEAEFLAAVEELGYPEVPVCFKPPVASGMRGFRVLEEGSDRLTNLLESKPDDAITTLDAVLPVLTSGDSFPELAVMEYLPGTEYSVDLLGMGDAVGPVVPRSRERTRAGISFAGIVEERTELIEAAADISRALGLEYNINVQFKYDESGAPKVIEINPRVAGTIVMGVGAGVNLPYLGVKYALGEPLPDVDVEWGTRMVRYWQELFRTPAGEPFHLGDERRTTHTGAITR